VASTGLLNAPREEDILIVSGWNVVNDNRWEGKVECCIW
jgi:hypothetical protein